MAMGGKKEAKLIGLSQYSKPENTKWNSTVIDIPVTSPTNISVSLNYSNLDLFN